MLLAKISNGGQVDRQQALKVFFGLITDGESIGDKSVATVMMMPVAGRYCFFIFTREPEDSNCMVDARVSHNGVSIREEINAERCPFSNGRSSRCAP